MRTTYYHVVRTTYYVLQRTTYYVLLRFLGGGFLGGGVKH